MAHRTREASERNSALSVAAALVADALPAIGADAGYVARVDDAGATPTR